MLTENQIRDFKKILDNRYFELREEIRIELLNSDDQSYIELAGQVHDTGEASVADLLVDLQLAEIDRHTREIGDIDAALLRIVVGEYGICTDCQASIDAGRLGVYPTAKRCYRCQVSYERSHAKHSGPSM